MGWIRITSRHFSCKLVFIKLVNISKNIIPFWHCVVLCIGQWPPKNLNVIQNVGKVKGYEYFVKAVYMNCLAHVPGDRNANVSTWALKDGWTILSRGYFVSHFEQLKDKSHRKQVEKVKKKCYSTFGLGKAHVHDFAVISFRLCISYQLIVCYSLI